MLGSVTGLTVPPARLSELELKLKPLLEATGSADWSQLARRLLREPTSSALWEELIARATVGETYFFRHPEQFEALRQHVLPQLVAEARRQGRPLRIWSAGCASGEEAYSLAILLHELAPELGGGSPTVLATDINRRSLMRAREALYTAHSLRTLEGPLVERYFIADPPHFRLRPHIRRMVTFQYLNLMEDTYPSLLHQTNAQDLILCRNVTIYFTAEVTRRVLGQLEQCLVLGGWLVVGPSEPNLEFYRGFERHSFPGAVLFRRPLVPARPQSAEPSVSRPPPRPAPVRRALPPAADRAPPPGGPLSAGRRRPGKPEAQASPGAWLRKVEELVNRGRLDEALRHLRQPPAVLQHSAAVALLHARARAGQGALEEARAWAERALETEPTLAPSHYLLGLVSQELGREDAAWDAVRRALFLDPGLVPAHFTAAILHRRAGRARQAEKSLENVIRLLRGRPMEETVEHGEGITAGRMLQMAYRLREMRPRESGQAEPVAEAVRP